MVIEGIPDQQDYQAVMPLTWNKKYGIPYLYQPPFTAALGLFGENPDREMVEAFIGNIPEKFRLVEIDLNPGNYFEGMGPPFVTRTNYFLDLKPGYDTIQKQYRENHQRNINRARQMGCTEEKNIEPDQVIELNYRIMKSVSGITPDDYDHFKKLYALLKEKGKAETWGIFDKKNELMASAVFFFSHRRAYYILVGNHPDGRTIGASHALLDVFIRAHAGEDLALDFEGSDIRNLAYFYSGFGAKEELYPALRINRLPWYVRLFKK